MANACDNLLKIAAVEMEDVCKSYGTGSRKTAILKNVNLNVSKGSIYGLLGPSGCGKTTLLKCVIGRLKVDSGDVLIFGQKPGSGNLKIPGSNVGYMPQELALYDDLKVREILSYFGIIFGMSRKRVALRITFLLELLHLPAENRLIKTLSGGQKRRVSFAIALLFEPPLLILDEPTVGVDPLLRQNIWKYLLELTKSGKITVIVTTHYVEEAKQADKIGFMRKGKILVEGSPQSLKTEAQTLEDVFLDICCKDDSSTPQETKLTVKNKIFCDTEANGADEVVIEGQTSRCNFFPSPVIILALFIKNCILLMRSWSTLLLQFAVPAVIIVTFGLTFGRPLHDLTVAVVNSDDKFGRKFLNFINNDTINQVHVSDYETAVNMVLDRDAVGVMEISKNFSDGTVQRIINAARISSAALNSSKIKLHLDMTDLQIVYTVQTTLLKAYEDFGRFTLKDYAYNEELASMPVTIKEPIYGKLNADFREYAFPGMALLIIFFMALALTALSSILERNIGIFDRNLVAGVTHLEVMIAHTVVQFGIVVVQIGFILLVAVLGYKFPCEGSVVLVITLSVLIGICGMCYGYVISAICTFESTAITLTVGSFCPIVLLTAVLWPIEGMPTGLQLFTKFLPLTLSNEALRSILSRGMDLTHSFVWLGFVSAIVWIIIFTVLSIIITKIKS